MVAGVYLGVHAVHGRLFFCAFTAGCAMGGLLAALDEIPGEAAESIESSPGTPFSAGFVKSWAAALNRPASGPQNCWLPFLEHGAAFLRDAPPAGGNV